ncbi:DUF2155 domain-containing protein [Candidatus Liberibacter americanus]|uniref:Cellulase-like protein n=1 Tax=Candidatus Liberibacter americanus str. Sao Paulo TaxID=1261131 RepID=U6B5T6_9HYPH|nr:DUF2155 domain-containing protein [Candidatus Liberibacter americanus]AHA28233.1 hypothetical protein lam_901 [Candidatus Liberibacter americanus str. Sao Paulo]EMS36253.1 hypothetical protein G653_02469 [Candidatus Liberibacter americanus PW_SP]
MKYVVLISTLFFLANSATVVKSSRLENRVAEFAGLDKITSRVLTFDVEINKLTQFGSLKILPRVCYSRDDREAQRVDAFVEISDTPIDHNSGLIFSGWMFADSPSMNALDHAIYDIWLIRCKNPIKSSHYNENYSVASNDENAVVSNDKNININD